MRDEYLLNIKRSCVRGRNAAGLPDTPLASSYVATCDHIENLADLALSARAAVPEGFAMVPASLLRKPGPLPDGCYCKPGQCAAPVVMGRQTACRDPQKAAAQLAPAEGGAVADILRDALNLRGVIADGDLVTLAERCRNRIIDDRDLLTAAANNDLEREAKPAAATRADVEALAVKIDGMLKKRADLFQIKNTMAYLQAFSGWDSSAGQFIADHGVAVSELLRRLSGAQ